MEEMNDRIANAISEQFVCPKCGKGTVFLGRCMYCHTKIIAEPRDNWGTTNRSITFAEKNLIRIGEPLSVVLYSPRICPDKRYGWNLVRIIGEDAEMYLYGLCWGYGGEGPQGLRKVLNMLGMNVNINYVAKFDMDSPEPIEIDLEQEEE